VFTIESLSSLSVSRHADAETHTGRRRVGVVAGVAATGDVADD
jgi:hypothetical protein